MPKVSVIIPVHNTENYLSTCLNSVLNQTEKDIEVIAINDHSTDNSLDILKQFEKEYKTKLKVIDLKDKYGVSSARNEGLKIAQGNCIGFVDSDDVISLNMYEDLYNMINTYHVNIALAQFFRFEFDKLYLNKETFTNYHKQSYYITDYLKKRDMIFIESPAVWDKLFKHDSLEEIKFLDGHIYEDIAFSYIMLLKEEKSISYALNSCDDLKADYGYRDTPKSIMNSIYLVKEDVVDIIDIAEYALNLSEKFAFNELKTSLLKDVLRDSILRRIISINKWNISEEERELLKSKMLSIANVVINDIKEVEIYYGKFALFDKVRKLDYIDIKPLEKEKLEQEKTNLREKIKTLKQNK